MKTRASHKDQLPGGLGDEKVPEDFDPEQLKMGVKVEMEHTDDPKLALEIAIDHLTEFPDYYTRLKTMEDEAEKGAEGAADNGLESQISDFLKENPSPSDEQIHQLAESLGVEHEKLEEAVYRMLGRLLAVQKKEADQRIFVEGDDFIEEMLSKLALSLYERGDERLGNAAAAILSSWR